MGRKPQGCSWRSRNFRYMKHSRESYSGLGVHRDDGDVLWQQSIERFKAFMVPLAASLGRSERRVAAASYVSGLLMPGQRKSIEPMSARLSIARSSAKSSTVIGLSQLSRESMRRKSLSIIWNADSSDTFKMATWPSVSWLLKAS